MFEKSETLMMIKKALTNSQYFRNKRIEHDVLIFFNNTVLKIYLIILYARVFLNVKHYRVWGDNRNYRDN